MTHKPQKITFRLWAGLQNGAVASVHFGPASLRCEVAGERKAKVFVMRGPRGEHRLDAEQTDDDRLNEHWRQFCIANWEAGA